MMKRRDFIKTAAVAGVATSALGKGSVKKPNIIFILTDQWRGQALGFMNEDRVLTPNLDRLAKNSAVFRNAYSTVPVCGPNRACLFSGQYSLKNGVLCNDLRLLPKVDTLGDVCKRSGYQTAYLGKWHLGSDKFNKEVDSGYVAPEYRHGFDFWYKSRTHQPFHQKYFVGDSKRMTPIKGWEPDLLVDVAGQFLDSCNDRDPFCMTLSLGPPHTGGGEGFEDRFMPDRIRPGKKSAEDLMGYGYAAPEKYEKPYMKGGEMYHRPIRANYRPVREFERSKAVQGYYGAITAIDDALGRFFAGLEKRGLMEDTIIVFSSDHGEMMGSQGRMTKGIWYRESVNIPMIVHYPRAVRAADCSEVFNSIDMMPTLLGLAGLPIPEQTDGTDFSPMLSGRPMDPPKYAFGAYFRHVVPHKKPDNGWWNFRTVYTDRYTYVLSHGPFLRSAKAPEMLYDHQTDPYEQKPILRGEGQDELLDEFKSVLASHLEELNDPFMAIWEKGEVDPKEWSRLHKIVDERYF